MVRKLSGHGCGNRSRTGIEEKVSETEDKNNAIE
jgi:hypothetical protein